MEQDNRTDRRKMTISMPMDVWEFLNDPSVCSKRGKGDYLAKLVRKEIKKRQRRKEKQSAEAYRTNAQDSFVHGGITECAHEDQRKGGETTTHPSHTFWRIPDQREVER